MSETSVATALPFPDRCDGPSCHDIGDGRVYHDPWCVLRELTDIL